MMDIVLVVLRTVGLFWLIAGGINTCALGVNGSRWPLRLGFALHRFFFDWDRYGDEMWFSSKDDEQQERLRERYPGRFDFIRKGPAK